MYPQASQVTNTYSQKYPSPQQNEKVNPQSLPKASGNLPKWITNDDLIPEVYKLACNLVIDKDDWIDTKRAYMLLMQTNTPPQYLGLLWEMVNRTKPGVLKVAEFKELLALVALLQVK